MRTIIRQLILIALMAAVSCSKITEKSQLQAPALSITEQTETSFTINWNPVENSGSYEYRLNGGETSNVTECSATFTDLIPGEYQASVRAIAADNGKYSDSEWSTVTVSIVEPVQEIRIEAYYTGAFYENGLGNGWINFIHKDGTTVCIDLNFAKAENPDFAKIPSGTYSADKEGTHPDFTFNLEGDSYVFINDSNSEITDGTVVINENDGIYTVECSVVHDDTTTEFTYEGAIKLINHSEEGKWSNLEEDVTLDALVQGAQMPLGDIFASGESIQYAVVLAEENYDLKENYGTGKAIVLYVNAANEDTDGVPEGTFTEFIDMNTATEAPAGTAIAGMYFYGAYYGSWLFDSGNQNEASLRGGQFTIEKDSASGEYTISGTLKDGYDNNVSFSYTGELRTLE